MDDLIGNICYYSAVAAITIWAIRVEIQEYRADRLARVTR